MLTPADEANHINKWDFKVPFVCGATNLGEALRRISEGAAMIRSKGEAGTGNVVEAVRHMRSILGEIRKLQSMDENELYTAAKHHQAPFELVRFAAENGRLPVVTFTAGGLATPADAAMMMQLGADGVFVGSGIFKSADPALRAAAIVKATTHYNDPSLLARSPPGWASRWSASRVRAGRGRLSCRTRGWVGSESSRFRAPFASIRPRSRTSGEPVEVRRADQLAGLAGLVIPGGESTTMSKLMMAYNLELPSSSCTPPGCRCSAPAPG